MHCPARLAVLCLAPARAAEAASLAQRLGLPLTEAAPTGLDYVLALTDSRLELRALDPKAPGPVYADFVGGRLAHRRRYGGGRGQPLARAVGMKAGYSPEVVDATAGLGRDGFVLASLGCRVVLVERSPVVAALLEDALARARQDALIGAWVQGRLQLVQAEGAAYLRGLPAGRRPDVVYLDPMFPERRKSALVKKEMRLFRELVGTDPDAPALLAAALACARRRVVVKRPKNAPPLQGPEPSGAVVSPNTRYDIYACGGREGA